MNTIRLTREDAKEIWGDEYPDSKNVKSYKIYDNTRWGELYEVIFDHDGKVWRTYFEYGSGDSDYDSWDTVGELECTEVKAMQVLVTQWFDVE